MKNTFLYGCLAIILIGIISAFLVASTSLCTDQCSVFYSSFNSLIVNIYFWIITILGGVVGLIFKISHPVNIKQYALRGGLVFILAYILTLIFFAIIVPQFSIYIPKAIVSQAALVPIGISFFAGSIIGSLFGLFKLKIKKPSDLKINSSLPKTKNISRTLLIIALVIFTILIAFVTTSSLLSHETVPPAPGLYQNSKQAPNFN